jgi:hypothetical protein
MNPANQSRPVGDQGGSEKAELFKVSVEQSPDDARLVVSGAYEDLLDEISTPRTEAIPRQNSRAYLANINSLTLPDGLTFWSLVESPPKGTPPYVESIWCTDQQELDWRLLADLRTGQKYDPEPESSS